MRSSAEQRRPTATRGSLREVHFHIFVDQSAANHGCLQRAPVLSQKLNVCQGGCQLNLVVHATEVIGHIPKLWIRLTRNVPAALHNTGLRGCRRSARRSWVPPISLREFESGSPVWCGGQGGFWRCRNGTDRCGMVQAVVGLGHA